MHKYEKSNNPVTYQKYLISSPIREVMIKDKDFNISCNFLLFDVIYVYMLTGFEVTIHAHYTTNLCPTKNDVRYPCFFLSEKL